MFTQRSKNTGRFMILSVTSGVVMVLGVLTAVRSIAASSRQPVPDNWLSIMAAIRVPDRSVLVIILGGTLAAIASMALGAGRIRRNQAYAQARLSPAEQSDIPLVDGLISFPNYIELRTRSHVPPRFWAIARFSSVTAVLIYVGILVLDPALGLFLFWRLTIPVLPALFLVAPGLWRNVCPLAASNQTPRLLRFTRALTPPKWLRDYGFAIGMAGFYLFASSRKWLFNTNGAATGALILFALASALLGGYLFKGKSGWCSSICPLYPVQRLYNRTPLVTVPNAYCTPCVGCTKNCYDFKPGSAYLEDLHDADRGYSSYRKFFAAAMPGFVLAYFTVPDAANLTTGLIMYVQFAVYMMLSVGVFSALDVFFKLSTGKLTALFGAVAFNLFYWFGLPGWLKAIGGLIGIPLPIELTWILQATILATTVVWIFRTFRVESMFVEQLRQSKPTIILPKTGTASGSALEAVKAEVTFLPDRTRIPSEAGRTLLEIAESNRQPIQAGCRMGVCGADPVFIIDGMENLPPIGDDERSTLNRLGLDSNCRLACMCKVQGPVTVSLKPPAAAAAATPVVAVPTPAIAPVAEVMADSRAVASTLQAEVIFMPDEMHVPIELGRTLLEIAENNQQPIEAGCRMGICGADPIHILEGMENLTPPGSDEQNTLERLGKGPNCRLACMCRVKGPVKVSLQPNKEAATVAPLASVTDFDRTLKSVVIIGNGVAGITAADYVRRQHPECAIHVISREKYPYYNRMGISRLIYGRSAMSGLYLQPETWFEQRNITCWLNTHVTHVNRGHKQVVLATGESIPYDRLILASGSSSFVPPITGFGLPGTYVLHDADEAMDIRAYVQRYQSRTAVVAGGGLLGLEAAYALHKMGLSVWVIERGEWLLQRQLDEYGGQCLKYNLEELGLMVVTQAEVVAVEGDGRAVQVKLSDDRSLPCDVLLVAAGIRPNLDLARSCGLDVKRGVIVDETMRTNAPDIFAAGDVCEFNQQIPGLWQVAVEQAKVAAVNAMGGNAIYKTVIPMTNLKVVGVDLTSIGRFVAQAKADIEIALKDPDQRRYRKLVITGGQITGAILLGYPQQAAVVNEAIKAARDVGGCLEALRAGNWDVLSDVPPTPEVKQPATPQTLPHPQTREHEPAATPVEHPRRSGRSAVQTTESIENSLRVLTFHFGSKHNRPRIVSEELRRGDQHEA